MNYGERYTDKKISAVNRELRKTYRTAQAELKKKLADFEKRFAEQNKKKKAQLAAGKISEQDYRDWLTGRVFVRNQWQANIRQVCQVMQDSNKQAMNIVNTSRFDVFAENYNFNAWQAEKAIAVSFNLYNAESVARLINGDPQLLPEWKVNEPKDYEWNQKKVNNIIRQGIIQGEGVSEITERLCRDLATSNETKMRMFARTALGSAQSAGRQKQMEDAAAMGIEVHKRWMAAHDQRTRDAHRDLDGQEVPYDKPFKSELGEIMFPKDPTAEPANVYNCRCTMVTIYPKYEDRSVKYGDGVTIDGQSYEEWKKGKKARGEVQDSTIKQGKDIVGTWHKREGKFDFEIEDAINAQGFDGVPKVVDRETFDKYVKESGFIAQRTYTAPDQETANAYRDQLYNGKFYVDCSTGGAQYGQGMYCAADYNGKLTDGIKEEMEHYKSLGYQRNISDARRLAGEKVWDEALKNANEAEKAVASIDFLSNATPEQRAIVRRMSEEEYDKIWGKLRPIGARADEAMQNAAPVSLVETLTLTRDAKVVTYNDLYNEFGNYKREAGSVAAERYVQKMSGYSDDFMTLLKCELNIGKTDWKSGVEAYKRISGTEEYERMTEVLVDARKEMQKAEMEATNMNIGTYATLRGYDAIDAENHGRSGSYTVILNRTKCIFLEGEYE